MQQTEQTRHSNDGMYDRTEIPHFHKIRRFFLCLSLWCTLLPRLLLLLLLLLELTIVNGVAL
jgi:hypothetical protein